MHALKTYIKHWWRLRYADDIRLRTFFQLQYKFRNFPRYKDCVIDFLNYQLTAPDALSVIWQLKDYFIDENYRFNTDNSSPLIYDCGANVGVASLYFKSLFPNAHIKAFEADKKIAQYLQENLRKNNSAKNVEIINKAVWIDNNGIEFGSEGADAGSIFNSQNKSKIESVRLKELIEKEKAIDFLKMDIEGAETDVIVDCRDVLKKIKYLFIEHHSFSSDSKPVGVILNILSENGFRYELRTTSSAGSPFLMTDKSSLNLVNIFATNENS